jgi:hypothetical protein
MYFSSICFVHTDVLLERPSVVVAFVGVGSKEALERVSFVRRLVDVRV